MSKDMAQANALRRARKRAGLDQADVARRLHVSRSLVSRWEHGHRIPGRLLDKVAEVLNAPELLITEDQPLNPTHIGGAGHLLEALAWVEEEGTEAVEAAQQLQHRLRHGGLSRREAEQHLGQIYDLLDAAGESIVRGVRETPARFQQIHTDHVEKVARYRKQRDEGEVA